MSRTLISPENNRLQNAFGWLVMAIVIPFAIVGALIAGLFSQPMDRTAEEVAEYIRAMLDGTVTDEDSEFDYDEFSCVPIADPKLESIARRACEAFEQGPDGKSILKSLLKETEALQKRA